MVESREPDGGRASAIRSIAPNRHEVRPRVDPRRITRWTVMRMMADGAMTVFALVAALVLRLTWELGTTSTTVNLRDQVRDYELAARDNALPLALLVVAVFWLSGFYSRGRAYVGRYKTLVIGFAVFQAYALYGFLTYLVLAQVGLANIPRGAYVIAAAISLGLALFSRTWTRIWERAKRRDEEERLAGADAPVKSVLVIGGAGYIGSALLPKLLDAGYRVRVLDLMFYGTGPIAGVIDHPNLELIEGDLRHVETVVTSMQGIDALVHLGAIVGDPACNLDEGVTVAVNLQATQMIADVAKASGIKRFLFASTCSVYGAGDEILTEHSPANPISLYGRTKLAAERGLQRMSDENFYPTLVRFGTIYGFSGRTRFDLVINLLSAKARTEGVITVFGGDQWRPFVHVDDAALAVFKLLEAPLEVVGDQVFNVGSNEQNMTISDVGRLINQVVPEAELSINLDDTDKRNYRVNFDKITEAVGFQPQWTVEAGIHQILDAIDSGAVTNYQEPQYSNVKHLKESGMDIIIRLEENDWTLELDRTAAPTPTSAAS